MRQRLNFAKFIIEITKYLWLGINALTAFAYILAVVGKIRTPSLKNLSTPQLILLGLFITISIVFNLLWFYNKKPFK